MSPNYITANPACRYYYSLLLRYARRIIKDAGTAELLVKKVLYRQYMLDGLAAGPQLRQNLKTEILQYCCCHAQVQAFNHSPAKLPYK